MTTPSLSHQKNLPVERAYGIPHLVLRIEGVASVLAGILMMGLMFHPSGEEPIFGTDPFWVPAHAAVWLALTLALLGWVGIYIVQAAKAGKLGVAGFTITMIGTGLVSWIFSSDVTFVPVIAKEAPSLFQEIFSGTHVFIGIASVLTWVLGYVLFGLSIMHAKVFSKWSGVLLIVGSIIIPTAYLSGLSVKAVAVGAILIGLSQIWLGYELMRMLRKSEVTPEK